MFKKEFWGGLTGIIFAFILIAISRFLEANVVVSLRAYPDINFL